MRTSRGRAASVFKKNPGSSGRATCADAVEQPDTRGGSDLGVNRDGLGEHPGVEGRTMDADEATEFDVGEGTPANQITKVALGDFGVGGERLEVEELRPLRWDFGAGTNRTCGCYG